VNPHFLAVLAILACASMAGLVVAGLATCAVALW
jgi:hypothetical protein